MLTIIRVEFYDVAHVLSHFESTQIVEKVSSFLFGIEMSTWNVSGSDNNDIANESDCRLVLTGIEITKIAL